MSSKILIAMNNFKDMVARSQAKQIMRDISKLEETVLGFDGLEEVTLDFDGVESIGQGFADEIFRVIQSQHPECQITEINAVREVQQMINRAKSLRVRNTVLG